MSCGMNLKYEDAVALKASLPALASLIELNSGRLLEPLLKNFTRGNARRNFELMIQYGVFNVLFPSPLAHPQRTKIHFSNFSLKSIRQ